MSSMLRRIQKKGAKIGVPSNPLAKDLLARLGREQRRKIKKSLKEQEF